VQQQTSPVLEIRRTMEQLAKKLEEGKKGSFKIKTADYNPAVSCNSTYFMEN
jgi:hypothetical protein